MEIEKFTDETEMPFGKFKGTKMANVPDDYLKWLYNQDWCSIPLKTYIKDSLNLTK